MSWIKSKIVFVFFTLIVSIFLLLIIDFFVGDYFLPCSERNHLTASRCREGSAARVPHPIYHHDLAKNFNGEQYWGPLRYDLCTDDNGFKISCKSTERQEKRFDLAFIGDSFTEGIGLTYEETFVGQIAQSVPTLKIANLGVSSYSPSIYLAKIKYLLEQGVFFKELVVYVDISDIQDEALYYRFSDGVVLSKQSVTETGVVATEVSILKKFSRWAFPLTYYGLHVLKTRIFSDEELQSAEHYFSFDYSRSSWTYNAKSQGYGETGVQGGIDQSVEAMTELSALLKSYGITLSVGVYPWPAQILYDTEHSEQVVIWREFCETKCLNFYNSFDSFFSLKKKFGAERLISEYFIAGDVHHNAKGAEIIANDFLSSYTAGHFNLQPDGFSSNR